jgi:hypothetical protein
VIQPHEELPVRTDAKDRGNAAANEDNIGRRGKWDGTMAPSNPARVGFAVFRQKRGHFVAGGAPNRIENTQGGTKRRDKAGFLFRADLSVAVVATYVDLMIGGEKNVVFPAAAEHE